MAPLHGTACSHQTLSRERSATVPSSQACHGSGRNGAPRSILNEFWTIWSIGVLGVWKGDGSKAVSVGWNKPCLAGPQTNIDTNSMDGVILSYSQLSIILIN